MDGIFVIFGTGTEAQDLAPVVLAANARGVPVCALHTGAVDVASALDARSGTDLLSVHRLENESTAGICAGFEEQMSDRAGWTAILAGSSRAALLGALSASGSGLRVVRIGDASSGRAATEHLCDALFCSSTGAAEHYFSRGVPAERVRFVDAADSPEVAAARIVDALASDGAGDTADTSTDSVRLPSDADSSGRDLGDAELALLTQAVRSGTLNSTKGTLVTRFEQEFARRHGAAHAIACASGSAAVHAAIAAVKLEAGDEVITTPITDMGALTPIVYEGAMPVFADVDPHTLNVTAATIADRITPRTRAIVATHLFGQPCCMRDIAELAASHDIPVIEDAAQAYLAEDDVGLVGKLGRVAAFSMQQGKHMTTGEGGVVLTDDDEIARQVFLFVNKAWGYGDPKPDHYFPALNYRMTELQGAVALAQLAKLAGVVERRRAVAAALGEMLEGIPGLELPVIRPGTKHSFWKFPILVDPDQVAGGVVALGTRLRENGVACAPRYIQKPAFDCALFQDWSAHPLMRLVSSREARGDAPMPTIARDDFPGAYQALARVLVLPVNEKYTERHTRFVADVIRREVTQLAACH